jgi:hypothetical protein
MADEIVYANGLKVCPKCGWQIVDNNHGRRCRPELGKDANDVAIKLGQMGVDVPSTKHGYGALTTTFKPGKGISISFGCIGDGRFSLDNIHWPADINVDIAAKIVQSLVDCAKLEVESRRCTCGGEYGQHFYMPGPRACDHCATCQGYVARIEKKSDAGKDS